MRSYRNKKDEVITVGKEHLETAVEIKKLLQKDSPSNRCSWAKHRQLMIKEGYLDSENSESYRQMIKVHQKSIGELPTAEIRADEIMTGKIESYKELVGELTWEKRENQQYLKEINKGKRNIIDGTLFIKEVNDSINNVLSKVDWNHVLKHTYSPASDLSKTRMVALITDWHIGADVDVESNRYNFEVARQRINDYTEKLLSIANDRKVERIDVVFMGDMIEGSFMRSGQSYGIEFPTSEQMARGGQLLIEMLAKISKNHFVTYRGFNGNHDRMNQSDKNGNIDGDSAMVVVNKIVEVFIEASQIESLMYCDTHHYNAKLIDINGVNIKMVHGDLEKKADSGKINDHSSRDGIIYDIIAYGHLHHFSCLEVGVNKFELRVGSIKGADEYTEKLGLGSAPSQAVIIVSEDGEIDIKRIGLT